MIFGQRHIADEIRKVCDGRFGFTDCLLARIATSLPPLEELAHPQLRFEARSRARSACAADLAEKPFPILPYELYPSLQQTQLTPERLKIERPRFFNAGRTNSPAAPTNCSEVSTAAASRRVQPATSFAACSLN